MFDRVELSGLTGTRRFLKISCTIMILLQRAEICMPLEPGRGGGGVLYS